MNKKLDRYLITKIRSIYKNFDRAHDERHFDEVYLSISRCIESGLINNVNPEIMLTAAAFHDVGCKIDREEHEIYSVELLKEDKRIKEFFNDEDINFISQIILHHRKSRYKDDDTNFNLYELLLRDADNISSYRRERALYRVVGFNIDHYKNEGYDKVLYRIKKRLSTRRFEWNPKTEVMKKMYKYPSTYTEWKEIEIIDMMNKLWNK